MQGRILVAQQDGVYLMKFVGDVRLTLCAAVDTFLDTMFTDPRFKSVLVDVGEAEGIDSTSLGILAKLSIQAQKRFNFLPTLTSTKGDITRVLYTMGFDDVFHIVEEPIKVVDQLGELPVTQASTEDTRQRVLEAHKTLMSLNENNRLAFHDLVQSLEAAS